LLVDRPLTGPREGMTMKWVVAPVAAALVVAILVDAFEVMILPRRVRHSYRLARLLYRSGWLVWQAAAPCSRSAGGGKPF
jgi:hypothetical protein